MAKKTTEAVVEAAPESVTPSAISDRMTLGAKAAVVVMALGEECAAEVLKYMGPKEIKKLSTQVATLGDVDQKVIDQIIEEFQAALIEGGVILPGGSSFLKGAITAALGDDAGGRLLEEIQSETSSLDVLEDVDSRTLASILQKEHPQTIALLMSHTEIDKAAEVVANLPEELQLEVVYRIARLDAVSSDILQEVEQALLNEIRGMSGLGSQVSGGVSLVADILNQVDKATESRILENIDDMNPEMAEEIRELMFVFEDLLKIDDRGMQTLLKEVENDVLVVALKTANETIRDKIFRNISSRASERIREDLDNMGPVRLSDVEKGQGEIVRIALKLEEEGRIQILRSGSDDAFV